MTIYSINPKIEITANNIKNIMINLINEISKSIINIYNIVIPSEYNLLIKNITDITNNYLKIYNFKDSGIQFINIQIYNQNINIIAWVTINLISKYNYIQLNSSPINFLNNSITVNFTNIYNKLSLDQQNNLRKSIISGDLYFLDDINLMENAILLKLNNNNCLCDTPYNYTYITGLYWE
jgi:hypothetical protein